MENRMKKDGIMYNRANGRSPLKAELFTRNGRSACI